MQLLAEKTVLNQWLDRNRCGSRHHRTALAQRLCPDLSQDSLSILRRFPCDTLQRLMNQPSLPHRGEATLVNPFARHPLPFLRVAASSNPAFNPAFEATCAKSRAGASTSRWASWSGTVLYAGSCRSLRCSEANMYSGYCCGVRKRHIIPACILSSRR